MPNLAEKVGYIGSKWPILVILQVSPHNEAQINSEWPFLCNSQVFLSFATKASHFIRNLKNLHFWAEGTLANVLSFSTFSIPFTPNWLKMTHNAKFCQKSGLDWLKMVVH